SLAKLNSLHSAHGADIGVGTAIDDSVLAQAPADRAGGNPAVFSRYRHWPFRCCFCPFSQRGTPRAAGPAPMAAQPPLTEDPFAVATLPRPPRWDALGQRRNRSRRQVRAVLLGHQVGGVPGGPVPVLVRPAEQVRPPGALLMLGVGGLG